LCNKISGKANNVFILDVRSDSAFRHISRDAKENAYGIIRQSVNIPLADLEGKLPGIPRNKEIIITDLFGGEAAKAAALLKEKGFDKVSMLIEGIDRWLSEDDKEMACKKQVYVSPVAYTLVNTTTFGKFVHTNKDFLLLDTRTTDEFANKYKDSWRNIGHLKNAVNIPVKEIEQRLAEIANYKNKPVLLYGFSADADIYAVANTMVGQGFTNVGVLLSGLFDIRWMAANNNLPFLKELVTDVPAENL
jgi:rhodanese-related sulfurtransferase